MYNKTIFERKKEMKRFNFARSLVLVLSLALIICSLVAFTAGAETEDTTGKFGGISVAYGDKVAVRVMVDATKEQIENGEVVVSYTLGDNTANATYRETDENGNVWVMTEGIAAFDLAEELEFSSYVGGTLVESGRKYSVAQFLYRMLYTGSGISTEDKNLYTALINYGEAAQIALGINTDRLVSSSTLVFTNNNTIKLDSGKYAFAPASDIEITPIYNGELPIGTFLEGWTILENGEEKAVGTTFVASGVIEVVNPIIAMLDPAPFTLVNGGFENGLEGWTVVGNIGGVSAERGYWNGDFLMDGEYMFSSYVDGATEAAVGTLTSQSFIVGGSGYVTFKIGAMRDGNYVYVDVVDANTKEILARYYNGLWERDVTHCTLVAYKANLSEFMGREVFFRISDNADSDYGLFFADSFNTYYTSEPEGFNEATAVNYTVSGTIYDVFNGGFEIGGVQGWWNNGEIGLVTDASGYWGDNIPYGKDGNFLFTGVESFGADTMREGNRGVLTSSVFEIGGTGYISFKLGGGGNVLCYVQVIDAVTGEVLARYRQQAQQDAKLIQYVADLSAYIGRSVRFQVVDQAASGWGCVSFDSLVTYYRGTEALPEGLVATDILDSLNYDIVNGSFENGLEGWNMNITEGGAHNTLGWVESSEHDAGWYTKNDDRKDGNNLFTFVKPDGTNCENTKGTLNSSSFVLKKNSYVSFRFGGAGTREVRIELCRADGSVIATFYNEAEGKRNTEMYAYAYQYTGEDVECFFRIVDDSVGNYGCFVVDDFRVNLASKPEGFLDAIQ